MNEQQAKTMEEIQGSVVRLLATNPAGHGLCLIGGFRYRFLDQGPRLSHDVDYHWEGDLTAKQMELISLFNRHLLPDWKRHHGYEGDARAATEPETESPAVRIVNLAFWLPGVPHSRIEIPVEITRIICLDRPVVRTSDGVVYPTPSDADLIESKVIALFSRPYVAHRDFVDLFLFANHLAPDAAQRVKTKFVKLSVDQKTISNRLRDFFEHPDYHIRAIAAVIADQLHPTAATNIQSAGGAKMVFEVVRQLLPSKLKLSAEVSDEGA